MTDEEHVEIRITRSDKKRLPRIIERILRPDEDFARHEESDCMYSRVGSAISADSVLEGLKSEEVPTKGQETLQRESTNVSLQESGVVIRRFENTKTTLWIVESDKRQTRLLDRIFSELTAKQTFGAD